jgi:hypothetical protein
MELFEAIRGRKPRGGRGVDQFGVVVRGCAGDGTIARSSQPGHDARMNLPGRAEGNWRWRCTEDTLTPAAFQWLHDLTKTSNRAFRSAQ